MVTGISLKNSFGHCNSNFLNFIIINMHIYFRWMEKHLSAATMAMNSIGEEAHPMWGNHESLHAILPIHARNMCTQIDEIEGYDLIY